VPTAGTEGLGTGDYVERTLGVPDRPAVAEVRMGSHPKRTGGAAQEGAAVPAPFVLVVRLHDHLSVSIRRE
jgi:hypothetical protein